MTQKSEILVLDPSTELRFKGPFQDVVTTQLKLTNTLDRPALFKIKTTAPKSYCVRPNSGVIAPGNNAVVAVMLQPFEFNPDDKPKHKFMVQSMFAPEGNYDAEKMWKDAKPDDIVDVRLRCAFEISSTGSAISANSPAQQNSFVTASVASTGNTQPGVLSQNVGPSSLPGTASWYAAENDMQTQTTSKQSIAADVTGSESKLYDENRRLASEISSLRKELETAKEERVRLRNAALQDTIRQNPTSATKPATTPLHPVGQVDPIQTLLQSPLALALFIFVFVVGVGVGKLFM